MRRRGPIVVAVLSVVLIPLAVVVGLGVPGAAAIASWVLLGSLVIGFLWWLLGAAFRGAAAAADAGPAGPTAPLDRLTPPEEDRV